MRNKGKVKNKDIAKNKAAGKKIGYRAFSGSFHGPYDVNDSNAYCGCCNPLIILSLSFNAVSRMTGI